MKNLFVNALFAGVIAVAASSASAQTLITENFDSYVDTAAMNAIWTQDLVGYTLKTDGGHSGNNYAQTGTTAAGRFSIPVSVTPTDASPVEVSFWTRVPSTVSGRSYLQLEKGTELVNFGQYNNPGGSKWNYRTNGPAGDTPNAWRNTGSTTQVANTWTHLKVVIESKRVRYYIDDALIATETRALTDWPGFTNMRFGFSPTSSGITVDYDDILLRTVAGVSDWNLY